MVDQVSLLSVYEKAAGGVKQTNVNTKQVIIKIINKNMSILKYCVLNKRISINMYILILHVYMQKKILKWRPEKLSYNSRTLPRDAKVNKSHRKFKVTSLSIFKTKLYELEDVVNFFDKIFFKSEDKLLKKTLHTPQNNVRNKH